MSNSINSKVASWYATEIMVKPVVSTEKVFELLTKGETTFIFDFLSNHIVRGSRAEIIKKNIQFHNIRRENMSRSYASVGDSRETKKEIRKTIDGIQLDISELKKVLIERVEKTRELSLNMRIIAMYSSLLKAVAMKLEKISESVKNARVHFQEEFFLGNDQFSEMEERFSQESSRWFSGIHSENPDFLSKFGGDFAKYTKAQTTTSVLRTIPTMEEVATLLSSLVEEVGELCLDEIELSRSISMLLGHFDEKILKFFFTKRENQGSRSSIECDNRSVILFAKKKRIEYLRESIREISDNLNIRRYGKRRNENRNATGNKWIETETLSHNVDGFILFVEALLRANTATKEKIMHYEKNIFLNSLNELSMNNLARPYLDYSVISEIYHQWHRKRALDEVNIIQNMEIEAKVLNPQIRTILTGLSHNAMAFRLNPVFIKRLNSLNENSKLSDEELKIELVPVVENTMKQIEISLMDVATVQSYLKDARAQPAFQINYWSKVKRKILSEYISLL